MLNVCIIFTCKLKTSYNLFNLSYNQNKQNNLENQSLQNQVQSFTNIKMVIDLL
jgi:hypothetical protein